jgi:hypothetical protein
MKHYTKNFDPLESGTDTATEYRESPSKPGRAEYLDPASNLWKLSTLYRRRDLRNPALFTRNRRH